MTRWAAVGFDLDGTLFDHHGSASIAVRHFLRDFDAEPTPSLERRWFDLENDHFESWRRGEITFLEQRRRRLRAFLPLIGVAPADDESTDAVFAGYLDRYRQAWRAFDDAAPLLTRLRAQGTRVGVLTNGSHDQQLDKLAAIGLLPLLDVVCISEELGVAKPDEGAFEALADRLGLPPGHIAFLGDNPDVDIAGARAVGMRAGLVDRSHVPAIGLEEALQLAIG